MISASLNHIKEFIWWLKERCTYLLYTRLYIPYKVRAIRKKDKIRTVFIITEVGVWKTELLYLEMIKHPRFEPTLLVLPSTENDKAYQEVMAFLSQKGYHFVTLQAEETIKQRLKPDIIFYQKPYRDVVERPHCFWKNLYALFCYAHYGFHSIMTDWAINEGTQLYSWLDFYENTSAEEEAIKLSRNKGRNFALTGLPMMDELIIAAGQPNTKDYQKKTIIWSPHHSITQGLLEYSTFLSYAQYMIDVAHKYRESVNFIFKPHPLLQPKLRQLWGEEKTTEYYNQWASMPNTRIELGKYIDIFAESDAMIHDCGSFTIEYLYFNKPVMYLANGVDHESGMAQYAKEAYHMHYFGKSAQDIETFIENVLHGIDPMHSARQEYYQKHLKVPGNSTACDNIIHAILGTK